MFRVVRDTRYIQGANNGNDSQSLFPLLALTQGKLLFFS